MTRQMQWEALHSERCACSSSAKQGEQVKPSHLLLTLCTAVNTSLRMVLTHTLSAPREDAKDTSTAGPQESSCDICKRETEARFTMPRGQGGGHLWAGLKLATNPLPLNSTVTWVPCHSTMTLRRCITTLCHGWSTLTAEYPSNELKATGSSPRGCANILQKRRKTT